MFWKAHKEVMSNSSIFLYTLRARDIMTPHFQVQKAGSLHAYIKALYDRLNSDFDNIRRRYTKTQSKYLSRFEDSDLHQSYSKLDGFTTPSQRAESRMSAAISSSTRNVEAYQMIVNFIKKETASFLSIKYVALACNGPVPSHVENHLAHLMSRTQTQYL